MAISCSTEGDKTEANGDTTAGAAEEGTPEACGNGICDTIEKEKGLCSIDCDGTGAAEQVETVESGDSTTSAATSESETKEITLDNTMAEELLIVTLDAYESIGDVLAEMQRAINSIESSSEQEKEELQEQLDSLIRDINELSDTAELNDIKVLHGTKQDILSATEGYRSAGTPWQRIIDAVNGLEDGNQKVEFTYSFIIEGTEMENGKSMELKDYEDGSISNQEFKQEIREAIAAWEKLFEYVFNTAHGYGGNLEIVFIDLGDETGTSTASNGDVDVYEIPGAENLGDLRYGMEAYDSLVTGTPFSPTGKPKEGEESDSSGDVHYNSNIDWRTDRSSDMATSVMIVTAHETGHGFAYQHEDDGLMAPTNIVRGSFTELFPNGLVDDDAVVAATIAMYGKQATTAVQKIILEDGTALELPSVNAATLGVSALKIRSYEEIQDAQTKIEEAISILESYKKNIEETKENIG